MRRPHRTRSLIPLVLVATSLLNPVSGTAATTATLSVMNKSVTEGTYFPMGDMVFKVVLSKPAQTAVEVGYATAGVTATSGADFTSTSGTLRIKAGALSKRIHVPIEPDALDEPTEQLRLTLSSPSGASIADGEGMGKILDDDEPPLLYITGNDAPEGSAGATTTTMRTFEVNLTSMSGRDVWVEWKTVAKSATGDIDYPDSSGTLWFPAGTMSKDVEVPVYGDTVFETDQSFEVKLFDPLNANLPDASSAIGWLRNDDSCPTYPADPSSSATSATSLPDVPDTGVGQAVTSWICPYADTDWFKITAYESDFASCTPTEVQRYRTKFSIYYEYVDNYGDLDLKVLVSSPFGTSYAAPGDSQRAEITIEWIGLCGVVDEKDFYIQVRGHADAVVSWYSLRVFHNDK